MYHVLTEGSSFLGGENVEIVEHIKFISLHESEMNFLNLAPFFDLLIFANNSFCFSSFPFLCLKKDVEGGR